MGKTDGYYVLIFQATFEKTGVMFLTKVMRSSEVSMTSATAKYSKTFLALAMIFRTSDSSNTRRTLEVPCKIDRDPPISFSLQCKKKCHRLPYIIERSTSLKKKCSSRRVLTGPLLIRDPPDSVKLPLPIALQPFQLCSELGACPK